MIVTRQLITQAYYLAEIIWIDGEIPTGQQIDTGLDLLNGILNETALDAVFIPYFTHQEFTGVIGQEIYNISDLIELSTMTYNIDQVRYQLTRMSINEYNGLARVNNLDSLPDRYYVERTLNSSNLYVHPCPS